MQENEIRLEVVSKAGKSEEFSFEGHLIGRSFREYVDREYRKKTVEIYVTNEETYIVYVHYREERGEIGLADCVKMDKLDSLSVRNALKEAGIYPGIMYFEAILHSRNRAEPVA